MRSIAALVALTVLIAPGWITAVPAQAQDARITAVSRTPFQKVAEALEADIGFERRNLLLFALDARQGDYPDGQIAAIYQRVLENVQALPAVRVASASRLGLLSGSRSIGEIANDDADLNDIADEVQGNHHGSPFPGSRGCVTSPPPRCRRRGLR